MVLVQDAFTRYFEAPLLADLVELISRLGYQVYLAPFSANGKPLHVQGFLSAFNRAALRNARQLRELADIGVPLLGLDPAMTLVYRQEYLKVPGMEHCPEVALVQEWLLKVMPQQTPQANTGSLPFAGPLHGKDQCAGGDPAVGAGFRARGFEPGDPGHRLLRHVRDVRT